MVRSHEARYLWGLPSATITVIIDWYSKYYSITFRNILKLINTIFYILYRKRTHRRGCMDEYIYMYIWLLNTYLTNVSSVVKHWYILSYIIIKSTFCSRSARGHYAFMKKTSKRSGFVAKMETEFLYFKDSCLLFSYYSIGNIPPIVIHISLLQEVSLSL